MGDDSELHASTTDAWAIYRVVRGQSGHASSPVAEKAGAGIYYPATGTRWWTKAKVSGIKFLPDLQLCGRMEGCGCDWR